MNKEISNIDKIHVLVESANGIIELYTENLKNNDFTAELRQVMASNVVTLSSMVEQSFDMFSLDSSKKTEGEFIGKHFKLFNELVGENMDLIDKFFVLEDTKSSSKKPKM